MQTLEMIAERLDPDEIVDRIGITSARLVVLLEDEILEKLHEFYDVLEGDDDE